MISTTVAGDAVRARPDGERRRRAAASLRALLPELEAEARVAFGEPAGTGVWPAEF